MDRASSAALAPKKSTTPKTDAATFQITRLDVGTEAVRPGNMAEMEEQRQVLLVAAKLVLERARTGKATLDSISQFALETAVKMGGA